MRVRVHDTVWGDASGRPRNSVRRAVRRRYLAKLSDWRMQELNEKKEEGAKDITKLVAGVSPFLEVSLHVGSGAGLRCN